MIATGKTRILFSIILGMFLIAFALGDSPSKTWSRVSPDEARDTWGGYCNYYDVDNKNKFCNASITGNCNMAVTPDCVGICSYQCPGLGKYIQVSAGSYTYIGDRATNLDCRTDLNITTTRRFCTYDGFIDECYCDPNSSISTDCGTDGQKINVCS